MKEKHSNKLNEKREESTDINKRLFDYADKQFIENNIARTNKLTFYWSRFRQGKKENDNGAKPAFTETRIARKELSYYELTILYSSNPRALVGITIATQRGS